MAAPKGIKAVEWLSLRAKKQRGGNERRPDHFNRSAPDALALWRDAYIESLGARNYAEGTLEGRRDALKVFLTWAAERDLTRASQITRPILESYQRWLWRCTKANGQRLGWSTRRNRLGTLKDWFRWLTRQDVILHNPASEVELPRMEKHLPQDNANDRLLREEITELGGTLRTNFYAYDANGSLIAKTNASASTSTAALYVLRTFLT